MTLKEEILKHINEFHPLSNPETTYEKIQKEFPEMKKMQVSEKLSQVFSMFYRDITTLEHTLKNVTDESREKCFRIAMNKLQLAEKILKYVFKESKDIDDEEVQSIIIKKQF